MHTVDKKAAAKFLDGQFVYYVQKLLQESKRRSRSSESDTDDSVEKTVMRHKISRTRSRITSDKSFGKFL
jgi:hypothetical protein